LAGRDPKLPSTTDVFTPETLPGLGTYIRFLSGGAFLAYDSKNRPGNPSSGWEVMAGGRYHHQIQGEEYGFYKLRAELTRYLHLFYERVLVASVTAQITEPLSGKEIPFFYLSEIGRKEEIRGYDHGRFRDWDLLYGTVEYRYPVGRIIDLGLFFDAGKVTPDLSNGLPDGELQYAYGLSFRVWSPRALVTKMDIGWSREMFFIYFDLN
jgi:outer membrane protein assembly factor BamA